jgi:pSer/pThr/pTyr-binding forkhead associated (FHA) protein
VKCMDKCPTCGVETRPDDNFCLNCGSRLFPAAPSPESSASGDATMPAEDRWSAQSSGGWHTGDDRAIADTKSSSEEPTVRAGGEASGAKKVENPGHLVVRLANGEVLQDYLLQKSDIVIGRVPESDINFPDDMLVSRLHARIHYENGQYVLRDEGSANGTLVNNQLLARMTDRTLQDGDQILIGDHELIFKAATPPEPGIEESETIIIPSGTLGAFLVDDERTILGGDLLGTQTMDMASLPSFSPPATQEPPATAPEQTVESSVPGDVAPTPVDEAAVQESSTPAAAPSPPTTTTEVTVNSFSRLSQPTLPTIDALLAASAALDGQIKALQQQLSAADEAMSNHQTEVAQTAERFRATLRHLAERMDSAIAGVARSRDEMDWGGLLQLIQDVISSPRDIGYATDFAKRAPDVDKILQRYQGVLNTLAECNSLLRGLIDEEKV